MNRHSEFIWHFRLPRLYRRPRCTTLSTLSAFGATDVSVTWSAGPPTMCGIRAMGGVVGKVNAIWVIVKHHVSFRLYTVLTEPVLVSNYSMNERLIHSVVTVKINVVAGWVNHYHSKMKWTIFFQIHRPTTLVVNERCRAESCRLTGIEDTASTENFYPKF